MSEAGLFMRDDPQGEWFAVGDDYYIKIGKFTLAVSKAHPHHPDKWFCRCVPFFDCAILGDDTYSAEMAQAAAIGILAGELSGHASLARKAVEKTTGGAEIARCPAITRRDILAFLNESRGSLSQDIAQHFDRAMFEAHPARTIAVQAVEHELRAMQAAGLVEQIDGTPERWTRTEAGTEALKEKP